MRSKFKDLKPKVLFLRRQGKSYGEIREMLKLPIPKSTLSYWCSNLTLSKGQRLNLEILMEKGSKRGLASALVANKVKREKRLKEIRDRVNHLPGKLNDKDIAKIALAMLYLGEGSKKRSSLVFGNSDPNVIFLFLKLLRYCYPIDEHKFRCTVQCRSDQDTKKLKMFWSKITGISSELFYKPQIDKRTIGAKTKKIDYRGVCRVDYFSADIFTELMQIIGLICE